MIPGEWRSLGNVVTRLPAVESTGPALAWGTPCAVRRWWPTVHPMGLRRRFRNADCVPASMPGCRRLPTLGARLGGGADEPPQAPSSIRNGRSTIGLGPRGLVAGFLATLARLPRRPRSGFHGHVLTDDTCSGWRASARTLVPAGARTIHSALPRATRQGPPELFPLRGHQPLRNAGLRHRQCPQPFPATPSPPMRPTRWLRP